MLSSVLALPLPLLLPDPIHTITFLPGIRSEFTAPGNPHFTDEEQVRPRVSEGSALGTEQVVNENGA